MNSMVGRELVWSRPSIFKQNYELRSDTTLVAELKFVSAFGRIASGISGEKIWTLERSGMLKTKFVVSDSASAQEVGSFIEKRTKRTQEIVPINGPKYLIQSNFWRSEFSLTTHTGELLAIVKRRGLFRLDWPVEIRYNARAVEELPWLMLLLWYYILLLRKRARSH